MRKPHTVTRQIIVPTYGRHTADKIRHAYILSTTTCCLIQRVFFCPSIDHSVPFPYSHSVTLTTKKGKEQPLPQFVLSLSSLTQCQVQDQVLLCKASCVQHTYDKKKFTVLQANSYKNFFKIHFYVFHGPVPARTGDLSHLRCGGTVSDSCLLWAGHHRLP